MDFGVQIDDIAEKISAREERIRQGDIQALNAGESFDPARPIISVTAYLDYEYNDEARGFKNANP